MNLEIQTISKDRIYYRGEIMLRKRKKESTLNRILEVPKEICTNEPKLTIAGFKKMLIENYSRIPRCIHKNKNLYRNYKYKWV